MIKVKTVSYQQDNVLAEIEYDLDGVSYSFTVQAKMTVINGMTVEEIKTYIRNKVTSERASKLKILVDAKLLPLIDIELEE